MIAIIIPTYLRADRLQALVDNIHAATVSVHQVYLILEDADDASVQVAAGLDAISIVGEYGSFAVAANAGYQLTCEPLVMFGNDDIRLHDGWDEAATAKLSDSIHVVGLNDGSSDCNCFHLMRRSFIKEHSGVFDKPNTVYHEYASQCPDTELTHYAMLRGAWAPAQDAVCEHVHWRFGKADRDHPNYVKAAATNGDDLRVYNERREQWDPDHQTPDCVPTT